MNRRRRTPATTVATPFAGATLAPTVTLRTADDYAAAYDVPTHIAQAEAARLAAEHDPTKRSACRLCGRWTGPKGAWSHCAGWKLCDACLPLLRGGIEACWADITGRDVSREDGWGLSSRLGVNPAYFTARAVRADNEGHDHRWEHLGTDIAERARALLARVAKSRETRPSPSGTGCAWCGVRSAVQWVNSLWRWGDVHRGPRAYFCAACGDRWRRASCSSFVDGGWRVHLVAEACGLPVGIWGEHFDLLSYRETDPADSSGTAQRWEYLAGHERKIRSILVRRYPRYATERERRVIALERFTKSESRTAFSPPMSSLQRASAE